MNPIDLSIRRSVFAWVLMFALMVFGVISLNRIGISALPNVDFSELSVSINCKGAATEVIESEILDSIEITRQ